MAVYRRSNRRRSVLVLLVLTSITLITLDTRGNGGGITGSVRAAAQDALGPVQEAVGDVLDPVVDWLDGVTRSGELKRENARLRRELADARGKAATARGALRENQELKQLAQLEFAPGLTGVTAQVVTASPGNFEATVGIDKGQASGVVSGMPVVTGDGLVGRITDVSKRGATVLLLTDPQSGVGVRLERSGARGIANGRSGSDLLSLDAVDRDVDVQRGELVFTEAGRYPSGLPVGRVASVRKATGVLGQTILVRPLVDPSQVSFVRVLRWPAEGQGG